MNNHVTWNRRLYRCWTNMRDRCLCPTNPLYKWYGAKGITICKEWDNYPTFYDWAIGKGYKDDLTIDRIDSKGNYEPDNCEWITKSENSKRSLIGNTTSPINKPKLITYNGKTMSCSDWSREFGLPRSIVSSRLNLGWTIEEALTTPIRKRNRE